MAHFFVCFQLSRQPFLKGDGFDLYVDVGVGMPYCCTVTKVVVRRVGLGDQVKPGLFFPQVFSSAFTFGIFGNVGN